MTRLAALAAPLALLLTGCGEDIRCDHPRTDWSESELIRIAVERYAVGDMVHKRPGEDPPEIRIAFPDAADEFLRRFPDCCELVALDSAFMWIPREAAREARGLAGSVLVKYMKPYLDEAGNVAEAPRSPVAHIDSCGVIYDPHAF